MTGREVILKSRYFDLDENWSNPDMVHPSLVRCGDGYRDKLGHPLLISPVEGAVYDSSRDHSVGNSWYYIIEGRNEFAMVMDVFPGGR